MSWKEGKTYDDVEQIKCTPKYKENLVTQELQCEIAHMVETLEGRNWRIEYVEPVDSLAIASSYKYDTNYQENVGAEYFVKIDFMVESFARCEVGTTPDAGTTLFCHPDWETIIHE